MDNCATCCTKGSSGRCDNDLYMRFYDRLGRACSTRWLVNNWRWHYGREGTNGNDAFDYRSWDWFTWKDAGCVKENGFDVPNKVRINYPKKYEILRIFSSAFKIIYMKYFFCRILIEFSFSIEGQIRFILLI